MKINKFISYLNSRFNIGSSVRPHENSLRDRAKKALALHHIQNLFTPSNKEHLENAGNLASELLPISISVPFLWARLDYKGRRAVI